MKYRATIEGRMLGSAEGFKPHTVYFLARSTASEGKLQAIAIEAANGAGLEILYVRNIRPVNPNGDKTIGDLVEEFLCDYDQISNEVVTVISCDIRKDRFYILGVVGEPAFNPAGHPLITVREGHRFIYRYGDEENTYNAEDVEGVDAEYRYWFLDMLKNLRPITMADVAAHPKYPKLVSDAAAAIDMVGEDELERFADAQRAKVSPSRVATPVPFGTLPLYREFKLGIGQVGWTRAVMCKTGDDSYIITDPCGDAIRLGTVITGVSEVLECELIPYKDGEAVGIDASGQVIQAKPDGTFYVDGSRPADAEWDDDMTTMAERMRLHASHKPSVAAVASLCPDFPGTCECDKPHVMPSLEVIVPGKMVSETGAPAGTHPSGDSRTFYSLEVGDKFHLTGNTSVTYQKLGAGHANVLNTKTGLLAGYSTRVGASTHCVKLNDA